MENENIPNGANESENLNSPKPKSYKKFLYFTLAVAIIIAGVVFLLKPTIDRWQQAGLSSAASMKAQIRLQELQNIKSEIKNKGAKWEAGDNEIFQLSDEERKKRANLIPEQTLQTVGVFETDTLETVSESVDWRNNFGNYVTPIKNQGSCGSCWAFAVTAGTESHNLIKNNTLSADLNLSEQTVLSCSGAGSCSGGSSGAASNFARDTGIPVEACYPYTGTNGVCTNACANWQSSAYKISSIISVPQDVEAMKQAIDTHGPILTVFNVYSDFYSYRSGVYSYTTGSYVGGHGVLIVGYDNVGQYFIVKNSWGTGWGESGFFRIAFSELNSVVNFGRSSLAYSSVVPQINSISVTSPNGGENWESGSLTSKAITWTYSGDSSATVKIELLKNGVAVKTLASSVAVSNKSFNWNLPTDLTSGSDYQIKITSNGNGVSDVSDGTFTIAPIVTSLNLSYPVGGEIIKAGITKMNIKWSFTGNPGISLKIDLLKGGNFVRSIVTGVNTSVGSYNWRVPKDLAAGSDYKVRITSNTNSSYNSTSENFSITLSTTEPVSPRPAKKK